MNSETLARLAKEVPYGSIPWFDLFDKMGFLSAWVQSPKDGTRRYLFSLMGETAVLRDRSKRIAEIIEPILPKKGPTRNDVIWFIQNANISNSPELLSLLLKLIDEGEFDNSGEQWGIHLYNLGAINSKIAAQVIAHVLDRNLYLAKVNGGSSPFEDRIDSKGLQLPEGIVGETASHNPIAFVEEVVPRVMQLIIDNEVVAKDGSKHDKIWPFRSFAMHHDLKDRFLSCSATALGRAALLNHDLFDQLATRFAHYPHENISYLFLTGWTANPDHYADRAVDYLIEDSNRLNLGYSIWSAGDGIVAISRAAVEAITARVGQMPCWQMRELPARRASPAQW